MMSLLVMTSNLRKKVVYAAGLILLIILFLRFRMRMDNAPHGMSKPQEFSDAALSVAKVSVIYGDRNEHYNHAVETHQQHAVRHKYPLYILRNALVDGYWNKVLFLLQIIIQELGKNAADRVEWLM